MMRPPASASESRAHGAEKIEPRRYSDFFNRIGPMWASPKPPCLALPHPLPTSPCATTRHADRLAADIGQFIQGMLSGGPVPDANLIRDAQRMRGSPGSYDYSSPIGYVTCSTLYFCCLFAFIAGSPFVYIEYFGVPPQYYGFLFGVNMLGMIATTFINSRIVVRRGADRLLRIACWIGAAGGLVLLATGMLGIGAVVGIALPLFVVLSLLTVVASNAISGALSVFPNRAGAAAALAGALQFGAGALTSAGVGWFADGTPRPMVAIIWGGAVAALAANLVLIGRPHD